MKRKILSVLASVIVVLTACICLVGCTKATPAGLENYMQDFVKSTNKAIHIEDEHYGDIGYSFIQLYDNKMYLLNEDQNSGKQIRIYYEYVEGTDKKQVITYTGVKESKTAKETKWTVEAQTVAEKVDYNAEFNKLIDARTGYDVASNTCTLDYNATFTVEGKWMVGKEGSVAEGCAFKIENKVLRINYEYSEKKDFHCARYIMNYGDVVIPEEAIKEAKQLGLK